MDSQNLQVYTLMHRNQEIGALAIDPADSKVAGWKNKDNEMGPYLGNTTLENIKKWWSSRAIPGSRKMMEDVIRNAGCTSNLDYLAKNLGLSMTDTYWLRPLDTTLTWEDVSLHGFKVLGNEKIPYHNDSSYDPNAALSGQMEKYWDLSEDSPALVKTASEHFGQQSIN